MAPHDRDTADAPIARSRPVGFDGEQFITTLLDRIEMNARGSRKAFGLYQKERQKVAELEARLSPCAHGNAELNANLEDAEAKIAEWADYALALYNRLNAIDPQGRLAAKLPKRLRAKPEPPASIDAPAPIPF